MTARESKRSVRFESGYRSVPDRSGVHSEIFDSCKFDSALHRVDDFLRRHVRVMTLASDLSAHEKTLIENALRRASGRVSGANGAAAILGMLRQTLESKLKKLGIKPCHFRAP